MHPEPANRSVGIGGDVSIAAAHPLDLLIALMSRRSKLFSRGWGDESLITQLSSRVSYHDPPSSISVTWSPRGERDGIIRRDGSFASPLKLLPKEASTAHVRAWTREGNGAAVVILAASRDEGYQVRERVFGPLVRRGIDLYFMENPFYGLRRTREGPSLITVSDHGLMVLGMVLEARALLEHLRGHYARVAVAGYSMGGHMAAITAAVSPFPLACAALAAGASATSIYTRGLLSWSVDYTALGSALGGGVTQRAAARERLQQLFTVADVNCFPPPLRSDAAVIAGCKRDGYVLRSETERLHQHWPGSTLRWIAAGHFSALVSSRRMLCDCVSDAVEKL
jgi:pimeloyl-ACP methyl ester carboxylesterase